MADGVHETCDVGIFHGLYSFLYIKGGELERMPYNAWKESKYHAWEVIEEQVNMQIGEHKANQRVPSYCKGSELTM